MTIATFGVGVRAGRDDVGDRREESFNEAVAERHACASPVRVVRCGESSQELARMGRAFRAISVRERLGRERRGDGRVVM